GGCQRILDHINTGEKPVLRVRTRSGYSIDVSEDHPLLVASCEEPPHFREARRLKPGLFACIDRTIVQGRAIDLPPLEYDATQKPQKRLQAPALLTEDLAWALGVIVGDGSYRTRRDGTIEITNQDRDLIDKYINTWKRIGLHVSVRPASNHYRV